MPRASLRLAVLACLTLLLGACGQSSNGVTAAPPTTGEALTARTSVAVEATYSTQSDWGTGFVGQVTLTNRTPTRVSDWQLEFDLPASLEKVWNARRGTRTGNRHVLLAESYNRVLEPGQSVTLGFQGSPGRVTAQNLRVTVASPSPAPGASPSSSPSPAASASPSPSPASNQFSLTYQTDDDWGTGFTGRILLRNNGSTTLTDWVIEVDWDRNLSNVWNGVLLSDSGDRFRLGPASWNRSVAPGSTVSVGFQGSPGAGAGPVALRLVGAATANPTPAPSVAPSANPTPAPSVAPSPTPNPTPAPSVAPSANPTPGPSVAPSPAAAGWFHTEGGRIVDSQGNTVRLTGVNWFGLETSNYTPHGLWTRNLDDMMAQIAAQGYNCLRVPYCNQMLDPGSQPNSINFSLNPQLVGKSGLQILDELIASAGRHGLRVILDRHRPGSDGQSALWYTASYPESRWIGDWELLAARYRTNPTVIGADLHNEPHDPATWGDGNAATDWRAAATRCGNRILAINPNWLILVEGIQTVDGSSYWWGGNLKAAGRAPVTLTVPGRLVYSPHDYPQTVWNQTWFSDPSYPANLDALWESHWGYLVRSQSAPVLLGEFGTRYETTKDRQWLQKIAAYTGALGMSWTFWSWNPNSGDTGGILQDDWRTINTEKQAVLQPHMAPRL